MLTRLRELTKYFGNHVEPENVEELKRTKAEVEKNVTRILKLIKNEDQGKKERKRKASKKDTELLGLVENFYKEYESLCALYDNLIGNSGRTRKEKECLANSSSDSEYYSSEETDANNAKFESEAFSLEVAELKNELASVIEHNKNLKSQYDGLKIEADKKERESSALVKASEAQETQSLALIRELEGQLAGLKTEIQALQGQNRDQEPRREGNADEAKQQGEKRKAWRSRVLELETTLKDKEDENSILLKKLSENEDTFTSKVAEMMAQVSNLQVEVDSLQAKNSELVEILACERENGLAQVKELTDQKAELEVQLERKTAKISCDLVQRDSPNEELARKDLVEKKKVEEDQMQERANILEEERIANKRYLQVAEKKIEDLAEKFQTSFEDKLRLLYQRILVTEQLHNENKESHKLTKEKCEKESREVGEKIKGYENEVRKMKEISELAEYALNGLGLVVTKFEKENGNFLAQISKMSNEIQFAKRWVTGAIGEIKRLKHKLDCLVAHLDDKEEQEFLLRDKVWKLEAKVSKEGGEKLNLIQAISQLEKKVGKYERQIKDKDERLMSLGDEKREAIRQLCIMVDYHRDRFDHLKQQVSKMRLGRSTN
ncbi:hypothetical protein TIFTF001_003354 [Ficus carica]|uniref:NAB domain-containing protein n=1 Tax=Ficus carica TaxID=3494 RepID=A0AA88CVB2_FICCA|nr:hypothetical protein TIFTF001_003354 [Ficus carica]